MRVTAPGIYNGSLGGLCGDYNGHRLDDFRTPNGTLVYSAQVFGDSWRSGSLNAHCVEAGNTSTAKNDSGEYCWIAAWHSVRTWWIHSSMFISVSIM